MSNTILSPNMNLPIPVPGVDPGPDYANNVGASFLTLDGHTHAAGSGVQIQPSGLNISSDLSFQSNNAIALRSTRYQSQVSALAQPTDLGIISNINGNLYWNNNSGTPVQITSGSSIVGTAGSISGLPSGTASASYSGGVFTFQSSSTSNANITMQSAILSNSGNLTNNLTLQAPTLSSSYSVTLPALPGSQSFLAMDTSGNISGYAAVSGGITGAMIGTATVTRANLTAPGQQISSTNNLTTSTGSFVAVSGSSVTITTTGNPVLIIINGACTATRTATGQSGYAVGLSIAGSLSKNFGFTEWYDSVGGATFAGSSSYVYMDTPSAGTYTYGVMLSSFSSLVTATISGAQITAYEIK